MNVAGRACATDTGMAGSEDIPEQAEYLGVYENGMVRLSAKVDWPDGTPVTIRAADIRADHAQKELGKVVIAGFGLAGRWVANIFDRHGIDYTVIETNAETVDTQSKLGRSIVQGDAADPDTLRRAGIDDASILVLTIPDDQAVLEATRVARALKPGLYIVARTMYASAGLQATQLGADEVIKAEQVVARQFYEKLLRKLSGVQPGESQTPP